MALAALLLISGCTSLAPTVVECQLTARCAEVLVQANMVIPPGAERISVNDGRARFEHFHAEVHACYPDGDYVLVDVMGLRQGPLDASIRSDGWSDPPCR